MFVHAGLFYLPIKVTAHPINKGNAAALPTSHLSFGQLRFLNSLTCDQEVCVCVFVCLHASKCVCRTLTVLTCWKQQWASVSACLCVSPSQTRALIPAKLKCVCNSSGSTCQWLQCIVGHDVSVWRVWQASLHCAALPSLPRLPTTPNRTHGHTHTNILSTTFKFV